MVTLAIQVATQADAKKLTGILNENPLVKKINSISEKKSKRVSSSKIPLLKQIEIGLREVKEHQEGKRKLTTAREFLDEMRNNNH